MSDGGEVVRGNGNAPGQGPGELMPSVTTNERKSLDDMARDLKTRNSNGGQLKPPVTARAKAPPPQTSQGRMGEFSKALEATQQAPVDPNERRQQVGASTQTDDGQQPSEEPQEAATEAEQPEQEQDAQLALDDKAALERYRAWESGDLFPEELLSKLHEIRVNGQVKYVDSKELRQGYARGSDARRMYSEAKQMTAQAEQRDKAIQDHFQAIRDPDQFLEIYERNGFDDEWQENVALKVAMRVKQRRAIVRAAGLAAMQDYGTNDWNHVEVQKAMSGTEAEMRRMRKLDSESRRLEFERTQYDQGRQKQENDAKTSEYKQQYDNQIAQLRPNAFKAYGITDNAVNRQALFRHLRNVFAERGFDGSITRQHLMDAAADLRDELDDGRQAEQNAGMPNGVMSPAEWKAKQAQGRGRPLPPNRIATGGGQPMGGNGAKRGSLRDLEQMVNKSRFGDH